MDPDPDIDLLDLSDATAAADYDEDLEGTTIVDTDELDVLQLALIHKMFLGASCMVTLVIAAANKALQLYTKLHYDKQPYHTSALSGMAAAIANSEFTSWDHSKKLKKQKKFYHADADFITSNDDLITCTCNSRAMVILTQRGWHKTCVFILLSK
ncbi:hypothetical protein BDR04DRAFT_1118299 [Suillus decipiens]|nr:hypothetical protein BDR04DRAFT_1118299 [Suillus decipiens]